MEFVFKSINSEYLETISLGDLDNVHSTFNKFSSMRVALEVQIFVINKSVSSHKLSILKNYFKKINVCSLCIHSNNRETVLSGKSLGIDSNFVKEQEVKNKLLLLNSKNKDDIFYNGTVRSGDRISSNGNLCIIGDVNPGAIVSAKKNIYVWGKLLGIAFAGKDGNKNACIASLYFNPLQLRIADLIALGPKDKPKNHYPEIALIDNQSIIIRPHIMESKN